MKNRMWFEEPIGDNEKRLYRILNVLYKTASKYQEIEILELANQGITLVLDGKARVFEIDEYIYHEGITYPPLSRHPNAELILVVGDGDGGIIRELLKREDIVHIDWIEIDKKVIDACACYLPSFPKHFRDDKRVNLVIEDGMKYISECKTHYDLIYTSVTAVGDNCYSDPLHGRHVCKLIKEILKPGGIATFSLDEFSPCSFQNFRQRIQVLEQWFDYVSPFHIGLPSFGTNWGFALGCDSSHETLTTFNTKYLRFYSHEDDACLFQLPKYLK